MASDISTVKSNIAADGARLSGKGSAQRSGTGMDFAEIIRKDSSRVDRGLNSMTDRAGITGVRERADQSPVSDERSYDRANDRNDAAGNRADTDDRPQHGPERDVTSQSERPNDYSNDRSSESRPETTDASSNARDNSQGRENHGENASRDNRSERSSSDDGDAVKEISDAEGVSASNSDDGEHGAVKGEHTDQANQAANGENGNDKATASTAKQMLDSLLANAQGSALPGQAADQAQTNLKDGNGKVNAAEGLNTAIASVSKQSRGDGASTGQSAANSNNTPAQTHNLTNTPAQTQAQNNTGAQMHAAAEAQAKDTTKVAEQAAQLSKMVGAGKKVEVSVSVNDEKAVLVSRPTASLVANTVVTADSNTPSLRSQQAQGANNASLTGQAQQATAQVAGAASGAQQSIQQAAGGQTQSANAGAIDAKIAVQGALHTGSSQATLSGNGETPVAAAPNSITAAQQAQQNTSTQAANSTRFTTANHAVADQVSVQITKALNAGVDKISIQLRPADMGRVDVQMEIAQDGRVMAVVSADNKNTLDLLQKDARELQQALQQAGFETDDDSLSFNLREQGDGKEMAGQSSGDDQGMGDEMTLDEEMAALDRDVITDTRIDVRA